jgi:hydrogenase expression/formation protein HypC
VCLAVPALLVEVEGCEGVADLHGNRVPVSTVLVPDARVGDWILMHAGFAIQRLDTVAAQRTWSILNDLARAEFSPDAESSNDAPMQRAGAPPG